METKEKAVQEYDEAMATRADEWVAACGGKEVPFHYHGTRYLYVFNPSTSEHAYINLDTDLLEKDLFLS